MPLLIGADDRRASRARIGARTRTVICGEQRIVLPETELADHPALLVCGQQAGAVETKHAAWSRRQLRDRAPRA